jgi:glycosyltransferase involved in cell wall biosynthesis
MCKIKVGKIKARKIKVLLLLHDLSPTGAPKLAVTAFEQFRGAVDLRTVTYHGGPLRARVARLGPTRTLVSYQWPGMPAEPRAVLLFLAHRAWSLWKARRWSGALARWKPDVVYVNSVNGLLAAKRLRLPPAPVVLHVHELDSFLRPLAAHMPHLVYDLPARYLAVSQAVAEALVARHGIDPAKVSVVPAFVDDAPLPAPARAEARSAGDRRLVVGGAGVISWVKGPELWLLTAAAVRRRLGPDRVRFVWVGVPDGDAGWQFGEMARKLGMADDLELVPFVPDPENYYAGFDVFALTSWEESASLALLENMRLGNAVACFAGSGGPRELAGAAGVVVPEFSPDLMADAVLALLADPARRAALGAAARRRVAEHFTAARQAPRLLDELRRLASQGR